MTELEKKNKKVSLHSQLIDFLAVPEHAKKIYAERFRSEYLTENESMAAQVLEIQFDHIERYGVPATKQELQIEFPRIEFEEPDSDLDWLIDKFQKRYAKNQFEKIMLDKSVGVEMSKDPIGTVRKLAKELATIRDVTRRQNIMFRSDDAGDIMDAHWKMLDEMGGKNGCSSGFREIDKHFSGWKKNQLIFYIGRPKRYKSWMQNKCQVGAQKEGFTTVFFPLEMGKDEQFHRYACMVSGVSWLKFMHNELSMKDRVLMADKVHEMSEIAPAYFFEPPRGERNVANLMNIAKDVGADMVLIDQLKFIEPPRQMEARHQAIELICEELKDACRHFPVVVSAQFNREAESMKEMGDLSKIGLSDSIGQTADVLMGLYQNRDMKDARILEFGVIDARAFDAQSWMLSVELSTNSNFRVVDYSD